MEHFVDIFSRRMGRNIRHIPAETMAAFSSYSWPGNIRELQNLVERAVILAQDGVLRNPLPPSVPPIAPLPSIEKVSRDLRACSVNDASRLRTRSYTPDAGSDRWQNRRAQGGRPKAGFEPDNADLPDEEAWHLPAIAARCLAGRFHDAWATCITGSTVNIYRESFVAGWYRQDAQGCVWISGKKLEKFISQLEKKVAAELAWPNRLSFVTELTLVISWLSASRRRAGKNGRFPVQVRFLGAIILSATSCFAQNAVSTWFTLRYFARSAGRYGSERCCRSVRRRYRPAQ